MKENNHLKVEDLSLSFGGLRVLRDLSLHFRPGEITGLIGPNGAGKTSLFNCLTGLYTPQKGQVIFSGDDISNLSPARRFSLGVARSFQHVALSPNLTVVANVMVGLFHARRPKWIDAFLPLNRGKVQREGMRKLATEALGRVGIESAADYLPGDLPPGTLRLVEIARALVGSPNVLLLDEPAAGLNSSETKELLNVLRELSRPEFVMVVVEHDMDLIMRGCDRVMVLNLGELLAEGTPEQVRNNQDVQRVYLG